MRLIKLYTYYWIKILSYPHTNFYWSKIVTFYISWQISDRYFFYFAFSYILNNDIIYTLYKFNTYIIRTCLNSLSQSQKEEQVLICHGNKWLSFPLINIYDNNSTSLNNSTMRWCLIILYWFQEHRIIIYGLRDNFYWSFVWKSVLGRFGGARRIWWFAEGLPNTRD
jgi:hypothetical protein